MTKSPQIALTPFAFRSSPVDNNRTVDSPATVGLRGRCPRCGEGHLFKGFLSFRPSCEVCGLDFRFIDSADGPAFFVMSIVGIVVVALAMWVEFAYERRCGSTPCCGCRSRSS